MAYALNLHDIQGNVTRAYGRFSFPFARYFFFQIRHPAAGRAFVDAVRREVTTSARWPDEADKPNCTVNIAFTFMGLYWLEVPNRTLQGMPDVFISGMRSRASMLGDRDPTITADDDPDWDRDWDPIWQGNRKEGLGGSEDVHILVTLNAQPDLAGAEPGSQDFLARLKNPHPDLEAKTDWLRSLTSDGIVLLERNGKAGDAPFQSASAVFDDFGGVTLPTAREHFGFTDGIGDPVFKGQYPPAQEKTAVIGRGKRMGGDWEALETGEFILGHTGESQELPPTAMPPEFMQNGTFMAYRKLHENVASFQSVVDEEAQGFATSMAVGVPQARETLLAKMCGRWSDGVPLAVVPDYDDWIAFGKARGWRNENGSMLMTPDAWSKQIAYIRSAEASDFRYADDMAGFKCPGGAHMRRMNTRDYLDPLNVFGIDPKTGKQFENAGATHALNKRRRILRRGLPYGPPNFEPRDDASEQGVIMMAMGVDLFRQFEFVQQQWIQYGLDFHQGNNTCPMLGRHDHHTRHMIPSDPKSGKPPYMMTKLKTFVECRGGDYFFVPSMIALRMIAMGIVDPT
ncbi:peroxidase [Salipiger sp. PrR002]|uniref:Dyp-type peroxidase n=1 Tax=Salipiger sp. PrR002 TaxID=2706489 RepID=UPI0013B67BAE|nr:peroxidase [Salipiger sp. PrR002]NDW00875.1 peroxidase [Salipiger sp. PrR002]NDW58004.1 peroxidase [Salipiger sp. PrR004]